MSQNWFIENKNGENWLHGWGWVTKDCDLISIFDDNEMIKYHLPIGGEWRKI